MPYVNVEDTSHSVEEQDRAVYQIDRAEHQDDAAEVSREEVAAQHLGPDYQTFDAQNRLLVPAQPDWADNATESPERNAEGAQVSETAFNAVVESEANGAAVGARGSDVPVTPTFDAADDDAPAPAPTDTNLVARLDSLNAQISSFQEGVVGTVANSTNALNAVRDELKALNDKVDALAARK